MDDLVKPEIACRPCAHGLHAPGSRHGLLKSGGGYSIAWSLLALAVMSTMIWSQQQRDSYLHRRNLAAENRSLLLQEISLIQSVLSRCALSTRSKYSGNTDQSTTIPDASSRLPAVPAGFDMPADPWYPYSRNSQPNTPMTELVCTDQFSAASPDQGPGLFTATSTLTASNNRLLPIPGLGIWSYRNRVSVTAGTPGDLSFDITSTSDEGRTLLQSLLQSIRRPAGVVDTSFSENPDTGRVTLTIRLTGA
jgi:hypothetical protein